MLAMILKLPTEGKLWLVIASVGFLPSSSVVGNIFPAIIKESVVSLHSTVHLYDVGIFVTFLSGY